jgi:hypothetical protein
MNNDKVEQIFAEEVEDICKQLREKLKGRRSKSSHGVIHITINPFGGEEIWNFGEPNIHTTRIDVQIGGMSRREEVGSFKNMDEAFSAIKKVAQIIGLI